MKVSGSHTLSAPRKRVWDALQDPEVLVGTIPGCRELAETGDGVYTATVQAGVASITGTYTGEVALADQHEPDSYTLKAKGQGGPGTIDATARIRLREEGPDRTAVEYEADAVVGGAIAGVGQRVLAGVAKRNAGEFFSAVERHLAGEPVSAPEAAEPEAAEPAATEAPGRVFRAPQPAAPAGGDPRLLLAAGLLGALIALLGVVVGRRTAR